MFQRLLKRCHRVKRRNEPERKSRLCQIKRRHRCQVTSRNDFKFSGNETFVRPLVLHADQSFVLLHQRFNGRQRTDVQRRQLEFGQIEKSFG